MTDDASIFTSALSRRGLLTAAAGAVIAAAGPVAANAAPANARPANAGAAAAIGPAGAVTPQARSRAETPPVEGLHLQFGAAAARTVVVSWHTLRPVTAARVLLGTRAGGYQRSYPATATSYTDAASGQVVFAHHAQLEELEPDRDYLYLAVHADAEPEAGSFRTAPEGRARFTFTSFGDQGTPTLGRAYTVPAGVTLPNPPAFVNDNLGSPAAADTVAGIERIQPLFHLFNGDLCYANLAQDRVRTWWDFWRNNTRSARHRPWMPAAGNHENELGNGPIGYAAYQTYFSVPPAAGQTDVTHGLWYSFTVGSVKVISLANDDVCYQDGGNSYVRGYSNGAQKAWLTKELASARNHPEVDWVVVCMHQVAISTADRFNGADLAIRQEWLPLFEAHGVDLVVCGHEHHYERSHPLHGRQSNPTLTPTPAATGTDVIDTSKGTVHMVIGGGGTSVPSNELFFNPPQCRVITAVGAPDPGTGKRPPIYLTEAAPWSAVRNPAHAYGFAAFTVDPGTRREGLTRLAVTYYDVLGPDGALNAFDTFTLQRPRSDASPH